MKVVLITGASSGLGNALALDLLTTSKPQELFSIDHSEPVTIINADIQPPSQLLQQQLHLQDTRKLIYKKCNVGVEQDLDRLLEFVCTSSELGGQLDLVIHCAGITSSTDFPASPMEEIHRVLQVNVTSTILISQKLIKLQSARLTSPQSTTPPQPPPITVINIASLAGLIPFPIDPVYSSSKFAVVGFTRAMYPYLQSHNLKINAVCPWFFDTPMISKAKLISKEKAEFLDEIQFVGIDVVKEAVYMAIKAKCSGECFSVSPIDGVQSMGYSDKRFGGINI